MHRPKRNRKPTAGQVNTEVVDLKLETVILKFHFGGAISLSETTSSSHLPTVFKQIPSLGFQWQLLILEYFYGLSNSVLNKSQTGLPIEILYSMFSHFCANLSTWNIH